MTAATQVRGRYVCPVCFRRFLFLGDKKHHIKLKHDDKPVRS